MTVQELIDVLQKVEDKSKEVEIYTAWVDSEYDFDEVRAIPIDHEDIREYPHLVEFQGCIPSLLD